VIYSMSNETELEDDSLRESERPQLKHSGRVANTLSCNARGYGFVSSLGNISQIYFLESIQSLAQMDLKWSVWHCRIDCDLYSQW